MRTKKFVILITCLFFCFCNKKTGTDDSQGKEPRQDQDTIVGSQITKGDKYGADKIIAYFVKTEKDTSYVCAFISKNMDGKHVEICFDYHPDQKKFVSYQKRIQYLRMIVLQRASKDFDLSRVNNLYFNLIHTGDLAIDITRAYERKSDQRISSFEFLEKSLFESQLRTDLDKIFKPYSLAVDSVIVDDENYINLFSRENMYKAVETDTVNVPKCILDCRVSIYFKIK